MKIETYLGPEMTTSEASAIWAQKSQTPSNSGNTVPYMIPAIPPPPHSRIPLNHVDKVFPVCAAPF
jgi:hypothetical protein